MIILLHPLIFISEVETLDYIPFEKPVAELESEIDQLRRMATTRAVNLDDQISALSQQADDLREQIFSKLTTYQAVQLSRHPRRPNTLETISYVCSQFSELHGDRNFFDDPAIVGGVGKIGDQAVVIIGHQKGRGTKENIKRNFGMPKPEGYRKALRLMSLAERFHIPIVTFIDTPGAYPGVGAEERGQSEAIGKNLMVMSSLKVPIVTFVTGEGGSGGALALGVANRVHMLQYSTYSVISPEGCASILMKNAAHADQAAESLKLRARSALELGLIDSILPEPQGGAHRSPRLMGETIRQQILQDIEELSQLSPEELRESRQEKFLNMGQFYEEQGEKA